jgi:hypothetical protein
MRMKKRIWFITGVCFGILFLLIAGCKKETSENDDKLQIGDHYEGGIVFYSEFVNTNFLDETIGYFNYLIAAPSDIIDSADWGCKGTSINCVSNDWDSETLAIWDQCAEHDNAASLCVKYNNSGYGWFLPTKELLDLMYKQKNVIGGFKNVTYWSSSEVNSDSAYCLDFSNGSQLHLAKDVHINVRPVKMVRYN